MSVLHKDVETFQSQALTLEVHSMLDYDPTLPPQNGHHYLYNVMSETALCPKVVVADESVMKTKSKKQTFFVEQELLPICDPELKPSKEWQMQQLGNFKALRKLISKRRLLQQDCDEIELPLPKNEKEWLDYCFGVEGNEGNQPLVNTMMSINQPTLERLLNYFLSWLKNEKVIFSRDSTLWTFSILACLETPLIPEICSSIRNLARLCLIQRTKMEVSKEDTLLDAINLIICIVAKYFRQLDLGD